MLTTRRDRKKEKNRRDLLEAAVTLFREKGLDATSIEDISARADVSRGTLYNYFPDKGAIVVTYFQDRIGDFGDAFRLTWHQYEGIEARLEALLDGVYGLLVDDMALARAYFSLRARDLVSTGMFDDANRSGIESLIADVIQDAQERQEIRCDLAAALIARNLQVLLMGFLIASFSNGELPDANFLKRQLIELFFHGAAPTGKEGRHHE